MTPFVASGPRARAAATALAALALLALSAGVAPAHHRIRPAPQPGSQCRPGERVVYSCRFGRKVASVCLGAKSLHYRFGLPGKPELNLSSTPDWSNIHLGGNRSQGGLNQDYLRFTSGNTHYVIHADETGSLNERPGRVTSGIVILKGASAAEVGRLECKSHAALNDRVFSEISRAAPPGWTGEEGEGSPFEAVY